jgi:hypothetical protein
MLMGVGLGVLPSNFTTPLRVAVTVALPVEGGNPPTFTAGWLEIQANAVETATKGRLLVVIPTNFLPLTPGT